MTIDVQNTIAFVTGANRGLGKAITEGLLDAGAQKVYTAVRNVESVKALSDKYGERIVPVEYDLTRSDTLTAAVAQAKDVNFVVSNAGALQLSTASGEDAVEGLQYHMERNVYPVSALAHAFGDILKANGGGVFVQLNSIVSMKTFPQFTGYSASKAASFAITQALRLEWAEQGTQVVSVIAGPIKTDMADTAGVSEGAPLPSVVWDSIHVALKEGDFFVFPDPLSQEIATSYMPFAAATLEISH